MEAEGYTLAQVRVAVAAPPTAAAQAVELVVQALKALRDEVSAGCSDDAPVEELKVGIHFEPVLQADAALAAWKEATRG